LKNIIDILIDEVDLLRIEVDKELTHLIKLQNADESIFYNWPRYIQIESVKDMRNEIRIKMWYIKSIVRKYL